MSEKQHQKEQFPPSSRRMSEGAKGTKIRIITHRMGMEPASFYVQSKGMHAGRTLDVPKANCWAVYSDVPRLKAIAYSIYLSKELHGIMLGSVIPFLRLADYQPILERAVRKANKYDPKYLDMLEILTEQIGATKVKAELLQNLQTTLARKINHELQIFPGPCK